MLPALAVSAFILREPACPAATQAWEQILAPLLMSGEIVDKSPASEPQPGLSVNRDNDLPGRPGRLSVVETRSPATEHCGHDYSWHLEACSALDGLTRCPNLTE